MGDKVGQHHAVAAGLARADGVEETDHDNGQLLFLPIGQSQEFIERFRSGVTPAAFGSGAEDEISVFVEGNVGIFTVDLGSGSGEDELALFAGGFEDHLRAVHVCLDGANGALDDELDAHSGGEVDDNVGVVHELGEQLTILHVVEVIGHALGGFEVADIFHAAGGEIVEQDDGVAALEQAFGQMGSDETGTSGD